MSLDVYNFQNRNDPYLFHVGYASKINSVASHNEEFQKTEFIVLLGVGSVQFVKICNGKSQN